MMFSSAAHIRRLAADPGNNFLVAAAFPLAAGLAIRPPYQGVEPPDQLRDELQLPRQDIAPPNVDELMGEDELDLLRSGAGHSGPGSKMVGRSNPKTAGPIGRDVTTRRTGRRISSLRDRYASTPRIRAPRECSIAGSICERDLLPEHEARAEHETDGPDAEQSGSEIGPVQLQRSRGPALDGVRESCRTPGDRRGPLRVHRYDGRFLGDAGSRRSAPIKAQLKRPVGLLQIGGTIDLTTTSIQTAYARRGRLRPHSFTAALMTRATTVTCQSWAHASRTKPSKLGFISTRPPIGPKARGADEFRFGQPAVVHQVLEEREQLPVEQPIEQIVHHLADDLARPDHRPINIAPPFAVGLEIPLRLEAPQVRLYGLEVESSLLRQGVQDLTYGGSAAFPDDTSDFELRLWRHGTLGHLEVSHGVRLKAIIAFK